MKGGNFRQAFTIIEVMLVLAITGLLFVGLIGGFQSTIRKQRYNDSVLSAENTLQEQYDLVSNVQNRRDGRVKCVRHSSGTYVTPASKDIADKTSYAVGMSECLVYGRLIEFTNDGKSLILSNIIGLDPEEMETTGDQKEIDIFKNALVSVETIAGAKQTETVDLEWDAQLRDPSPSTAWATGGLMILRSPISGTVWTYRFTGTAAIALSSKVEAVNIGSKSLCIISNDAEPSQRRAIIIGSTNGGIFAGANASSVQVAPKDVTIGEGANKVEPVKCE